jgi:urate oxidase
MPTASRIAASSHGESRLRLLRIVRRGDRHDPRDLTVSFRFEGDTASAFTAGEAAGLLPGETVKRMVHAAVREHGAKEIEKLGLALAEDTLRRQPKITRVRVEISEHPWQRLEAGGKAQAQAFLRGSGERRIAVVTSNGRQVSVVAGIQHLAIMRSAGFAPSVRANTDDGTSDGLPRLVIGELSARWTYTSGDVTFDPYRHGVRAALIETVAWHASRSVQHALYAAADVILSTFEDIADITLSFLEHPYRPADPLAVGAGIPDDLFVAIEEPLGVVEVTVERAPNVQS